jgi:TetR/AcrR family transcriptional repressor of mexJK operon
MAKAVPIAGSSATTENKDAKSEFLLEIASKTFLEEGFAGTSVGEIARRAHASKETFYSRYVSKEQLFEAVMRRLVGRFTDKLGAMMVPEEPPEKVLTAFAGKILERTMSDDGIALQKIVQMESRRFPTIARLFFELGPQRTLSALGRYFESQVAQNRLRPLDGEVAAGHFMGILTSDLMMRRSLGVLGKKPTSEENNKRIQTAVDVFLRAYKPD